ncbi:hypothetical protein I4U23_010010 [Adineta vaga]|nr:hypothetical protein I4U23_010010 [Adineta vaga]
MNTSSSSVCSLEEYINAAPDPQLSASESKLLVTLLSEEDQYQYNQLLNIVLPDDIQHLLHQISLLLHLSSSAIWMATILLKKLLIEEHSLDLLIILACVTLSSKYQDSSSQPIDYELLAHCCQIENIQHIHDAETDLLELFSYDITALTPDHFFTYLSNLDNDCKHLVGQVQSLLSQIISLPYETSKFIHTYPCSIVVLSLICMNTTHTFAIEHIKSFLAHKKDSSYYLNQLLHCTAQFHTVLSS